MLGRCYLVVSHLGWRWLWFRLVYWLKGRIRWHRFTCPRSSWNSIVLPEEGVSFEKRPFFFSAGDFEQWRGYLEAWDRASIEGPMPRAKRIREGRFVFYSWDEIAPGCPPRWHVNAFTGEEVPSGRHWSALSDFGFGDIKHIWELSRFSWVYVLVRAFARDGDAGHAEVYRRLLEDWLERNPPNTGPQWKCGQEVAIRLMGVLYGWFGFAEVLPEALRERICRLAWVSGRRIEANISFAFFQFNNHGLSEAAGLWTIGLLFPEFEEAARWKAQGRRLLETQARTLIYEDGGCSQASFNYERVMLDVLAWCWRLSELHEEPLDACVRSAVERASELLWQCQDELSGQLPNYGANDGALLLPLSNADYADFRPALQVASFLTSQMRRYPEGPQDEALLWFYGESGLSSPLSRKERMDFRARESGYFTLRNAHGYLFLRSGRHRHRPSHADQLHVDLWWHGRNVLLDCGTYSYNAAQPFDEAFKSTRFHNTVRVDRIDQMGEAGRFLWLPWAQGRLVKAGSASLCAEHDGYQRLQDPVNHRRSVIRVEDHGFLIVDRLQGTRDSHEFELLWHLPGDVEQQEDGGVVVACGDHRCLVQVWCEQLEWTLALNGASDEDAEGWYSRYYMKKDRGKQLTATVEGHSVMLATWVGGEKASIRAGAARGLELEVAGSRRRLSGELWGE